MDPEGFQATLGKYVFDLIQYQQIPNIEDSDWD